MRNGWICLLLLLLASCAPRVEPVRVEFTRVEVEEMTDASVELKMHNPNGFRVDVDRLEYALLLTADTVASGRRDEPVRIEAEDSTLASFPFTIDLGSIGDLSGILEDTLSLRVDGRYLVPGTFGKVGRPFEYRHDIPLGELVEDILAPFRGLFGGDE